ncbi:MAG: hypothetical protein WD431_14195 [Cyclobacteriaceae bacterium]
MKSFGPFVKLVNILSLDVVLGACGGMYFFSKLMKVSPNWKIYVLLAMAVWAIYTFDHLLDAYLVKGRAHTERHYFHQRHFNPLVFILGLVVVSGLTAAYLWVDWDRIFAAGLILGGLIIGNMVLLRWSGKWFVLIKEFSIALLYVGGILLAPISLLDMAYSPGYWMFFAMAYFILACYNLILLSWMDKDSDSRDGHYSILTVLGAQITRQLLWILSILGLAYIPFLFLFLPSYYHVFTLLWTMMWIGHIIIFLESPLDIYQARQTLEGIFLLPLLLVFL